MEKLIQTIKYVINCSKKLTDIKRMTAYTTTKTSLHSGA